MITDKFGGGSVANLCTGQTDEMGLHVVRTTGSAEHLEALAHRGQTMGLSWTESGVVLHGDKIAYPTEEDVYAAFELEWIPPELRAGLGEIEAAAQGGLPKLLDPADLRGFIHCHSDYSDGTTPVRARAPAAPAPCPRAGAGRGTSGCPRALTRPPQPPPHRLAQPPWRAP